MQQDQDLLDAPHAVFNTTLPSGLEAPLHRELKQRGRLTHQGHKGIHALPSHEGVGVFPGRETHYLNRQAGAEEQIHGPQSGTHAGGVGVKHQNHMMRKSTDQLDMF